MNDLSKIGASHLSRTAYIYLRQSSPTQVEHNRESTQRQYALATKANALGWPSQQVVVIDEDLGLSGPASSYAAASQSSQLRSRSVMLASCSAWKSPASPAIMRTGIALSIYAVSPIHSSAMPTASITPPFSTTDCCSALRAR